MNRKRFRTPCVYVCTRMKVHTHICACSGHQTHVVQAHLCTHAHVCHLFTFGTANWKLYPLVILLPLRCGVVRTVVTLRFACVPNKACAREEWKQEEEEERVEEARVEEG